VEDVEEVEQTLFWGGGREIASFYKKVLRLRPPVLLIGQCEIEDVMTVRSSGLTQGPRDFGFRN
jgi:hypothetical protein